MATPQFDSPDYLWQYEEKKDNLIQQYRHLLQTKNAEVGLEKDTSNLFRTRHIARNKIDVRHFNQVLKVDPRSLTAEVEGMTPYETIVKETLKYHCLPTVVPELKSITIGGALSGGGIESSSFRYGLVHETLLEYDILLGDGQVVTCRKDNEYRDLYYGFPNTYGTLGYALKVKLKLIPAKKYIKLTHLQFPNAEAFFNAMQEICQNNRNPTQAVSYVEGVIFSKDQFYITTAEFQDQVTHTSDYTYLKPYYKSIQKLTQDFLKTEDYIWRWDTDWFWCSKHFYMDKFLMRLLFGKFLLNSKQFWKMRNFFSRNLFAKRCLELLRTPTESVIQDVEIPIEKSSEFLEFFMKELKIWPIWICPTQSYNSIPYSFYHMDPKKLYINFGFWDTLPSQHPNGFYNRKIEQKVQALGGNKSLYSNVFYTEQEFWSIFDQKQYLHLKDIYDPKQHFKNLYDKCSEKQKN